VTFFSDVTIAVFFLRVACWGAQKAQKAEAAHSSETNVNFYQTVTAPLPGASNWYIIIILINMNSLT
jgi:hypothetical protein